MMTQTRNRNLNLNMLNQAVAGAPVKDVDTTLVQALGYLQAGHAQTQLVALQEDVPVRVFALSEGDTDIYIYDRFGALVEFDTNPGVQSECTWTPMGTGEYLIKIVNPTQEATAYMLTVILPTYEGRGLKRVLAR